LKADVKSAEELCGKVLDASEEFTNKPRAENDVTALVLLRAAAKAATPAS